MNTTQENLNQYNFLEILYNYVEKAQEKGCFSLDEAVEIKKGYEYLISQNNKEKEVILRSFNNLINSCQKGQLKGGVYNLQDAYNIFQIYLFIQNNIENLIDFYTLHKTTNISQIKDDVSTDLSELSEPVPLSNIVEI
jgi:ribosomal protein L6P/L9E